MHFWFARRTTAIRYYSPSRRMLRSVLNFRNTRRWNEPLRRVEKLSVSSESTPGDVNRNPNRPGDHLLSACERSIARTLLIVTFIFGACPCTSRDSASILPFFGVGLVIGGSLSLARILFAQCMRYARETRVSGPSPSKQREACKTAEKGNVDIVAYSDMLRRWLARKENLSNVGRERSRCLKSNALFVERNANQANFIVLVRIRMLRVFLISFFYIAGNIIESWRLP